MRRRNRNDLPSEREKRSTVITGGNGIDRERQWGRRRKMSEKGELARERNGDIQRKIRDYTC
jgi:hypothetical protein